MENKNVLMNEKHGKESKTLFCVKSEEMNMIIMSDASFVWMWQSYLKKKI